MAIERTLVLIKPDGVKRNLIGEIIGRYESQGLKIIGLKVLNVSDTLVRKHYPDTMAEGLGEKSARAGGDIADKVEQGKNVLKWLRKFIMSHMIVAICFEGEDAIKKVRKITGYTDPAQADKGTLRGDLGVDSILKANEDGRPVYNLVHASGNPEEAKQELANWFSKSELYKR